MTITLRIDGDSRSIVVFEELSSNYTFEPKSAPNSDSESKIWQFCLLTYPPSVKCTSSPKKILFEKLPSTACCSAPIPRINDVMNGQLTSVIAWAGLYMVVGVDLNAKYGIMCCKTVLIPENEEESTKWMKINEI